MFLVCFWSKEQRRQPHTTCAPVVHRRQLYILPATSPAAVKLSKTSTYMLYSIAFPNRPTLSAIYMYGVT
jgi:hypothetical protein